MFILGIGLKFSSPGDDGRVAGGVFLWTQGQRSEIDNEVTGGKMKDR